MFVVPVSWSMPEDSAIGKTETVHTLCSAEGCCRSGEQVTSWRLDVNGRTRLLTAIVCLLVTFFLALVVLSSGLPPSLHLVLRCSEITGSSSGQYWLHIALSVRSCSLSSTTLCMLLCTSCLLYTSPSPR